VAEYVTRRHVVAFLDGFLIGKVIGALVSLIPVWGLMVEDPILGGLVLEEFFVQLLSFNTYHYALAIIGGLILAILVETRRLEEE
jgi:hypothetical protein